MKKNEILFVLYLFIFTILNVLLETFKNYSTIILFITTLLIVGISILNNLVTKNRIQVSAKKIHLTIILILLIIMLFLFNSITFKENNIIIRYLYNFIIYGIIPCYLYIFVKDIKKCLQYYINFSIILIIMYGITPFTDTNFFGDYMSFGFNCILPTTIGLYIGIRYFKRKKLIILELMALFELIFFCNRGAILTLAIFIMLYELIIEKSTTKKLILCIVGICILLIVFMNLQVILDKTINYLNKNGIYSYSIIKLYNYANNVDNNLFSGRNKIWSQCIEEYKLHPIMGSGIGSFEFKYNYYPHNVFLEILTSFGIIGLVIYIVIIAKGIHKIICSHDEEKVWGLLLLVMSVIPLMFSLTIFTWMYFWIFIIFAMETKRRE